MERYNNIRKRLVDKIKVDRSNLLDRYTRMDELLYENQLALKELIANQNVTNKLLIQTNKLLIAQLQQSYPTTPIVTSAIGELAGEEELKSITDILTEDYVTNVHSFNNLVITGNQEVFELEGTGILAEAMFKSSTSSTDNKSYSIRIKRDNINVYEDTWTNYESRSYYERDMTCYEDTDNSYYILTFRDVAFEQKLIIEVYESSATFTQIYIKYHEKS